MSNSLTAVFEQTSDGWIGSAEKPSGANTQGATIDEARDNQKEAVGLVLEANRELARRQNAGRSVIRASLNVAR